MAQNDFILQQIADLTGKGWHQHDNIHPGLPVVRPDTVEMSAWGVAALAGIQVTGRLPSPRCQAGVWAGRQEVVQLRPKGTTFLRQEGRQETVEAQYARWEGFTYRVGHDSFQVERGLQEDAALASCRGRLSITVKQVYIKRHIQIYIFHQSLLETVPVSSLLCKVSVHPVSPFTATFPKSF